MSRRRMIFIANVDRILTAHPTRPIKGKNAQKVSKISQRFAHYGDWDVIVLPGEVDPSFAAYAATLGSSPEIYVPSGINPDRLSIMDAFSDPGLLELLRGAEVDSYLRTMELYELVTTAGGYYAGGRPGDRAHLAQSKEHYIEMAQGAVQTPPNCVVLKGVNEIAREIQDRLFAGRDVFVRLDKSGGGFGLRWFAATEWPYPDLEEIVKTLEGDDAESWLDGKALVEDYVDLSYSPAVDFNGDRVLYTQVQINRDGSNAGRWMPCPPWICSYTDLERIALHFSAELAKLGFSGDAGTDLGIDASGNLYGFEINGRKTGSRDSLMIGERLHGQFSTWMAQGVACKSVTDFHLRRPMSFEELHSTLNREGLLASLSHPWGAVILIPPVGTVAGIATFGRGYEEAEAMYQRIDGLVGNPTLNTDDSPLFPQMAASRA